MYCVCIEDTQHSINTLQASRLLGLSVLWFIISQHRHNNHLLLGNKPMQWRFHQNPILKSKTGFISCIYQFCYFCSKARTVRVRERHTAIKSFLNFHISTVTQQKALIFWACIHRRVFCDSIRIGFEFEPRDGARGQNLGHFCKVLLCLG